MNNEQPAKSQKSIQGSGFFLALPFLVVLGAISLASFLIPLRPTVSSMEKRKLAEFPVFTLSSVEDGSYFSEITYWFSDTFPGREKWLTLSSDISSLHGYSKIEIAGEMPLMDAIPPVPILQETEPTVTAPPAVAITETAAAVETLETAPQESEPPAAPVSPTDASTPETVKVITEPTTATETSAPAAVNATQAATAETQPGWGGITLDNTAELEFANTVIQIGNSAFNPVGFSQMYSDSYANSLSNLAGIAETFGARVISAPAPTAVGILLSAKDQEQLNCVDQSKIIQYFHSQMDNRVVTVDTFSALVAHNNEYIYFRTDHHWTARGAYYAYRAICEALDLTPVPLEELEEMDQGEFEGSLYWKSPHPKRLELDTLIAYQPKGDFTMRVCDLSGYGTERPLIQDMSQRERNTKYSAFLFSDNPLVEVTNHSLPEGPTCLVVKDSFGNVLVPFLAQNYSTVYAIDYRKFHEATIRGFLLMHPVDDIIFAPYIIATQSSDGSNMFRTLCS